MGKGGRGRSRARAGGSGSVGHGQSGVMAPIKSPTELKEKYKESGSTDKRSQRLPVLRLTLMMPFVLWLYNGNRPVPFALSFSSANPSLLSLYHRCVVFFRGEGVPKSLSVCSAHKT